MRRLQLQLEAAGLTKLSPTFALLAIFSLATIASVAVQLQFEVVGLTVSIFLVVCGGAFELLSLRARSRADNLAKLWPQAIDSLQSGATSGLSVIDSLAELATHGPTQLRKPFIGLIEKLDSGWSLDNGLDWLKTQFGEIHADRLIELIRITHQGGGLGFIDALRQQSRQTRSEIALWGELNSKQGWVSATAKLALVAPWFIVATLASRPENVGIYNSTEGIVILLSGLLVSILAYRLIGLLGALSRPNRVFVT